MGRAKRKKQPFKIQVKTELMGLTESNRNQLGREGRDSNTPSKAVKRRDHRSDCETKKTGGRAEKTGKEKKRIEKILLCFCLMPAHSLGRRGGLHYPHLIVKLGKGGRFQGKRRKTRKM